MFQHFDADRLGEPPEEDPSPGAVESDIMLTDEQKAALDQSNKGISTLMKRKTIANAFQRWPHKTVLYKISLSARMYSKSNIVFNQQIAFLVADIVRERLLFYRVYAITKRERELLSNRKPKPLEPCYMWMIKR